MIDILWPVEVEIQYVCFLVLALSVVSVCADTKRNLIVWSSLLMLPLLIPILSCFLLFVKDFDDEMSGNRSNSEKTTTLEQCLQLFTETETLAPEEAW